MKKYILVGLFFVAILFNVTKVEAQQGCCSHHGGVYGCNEMVELFVKMEL